LKKGIIGGESKGREAEKKPEKEAKAADFRTEFGVGEGLAGGEKLVSQKRTAKRTTVLENGGTQQEEATKETAKEWFEFYQTLKAAVKDEKSEKYELAKQLELNSGKSRVIWEAG
jgi:hypothetical protein